MKKFEYKLLLNWSGQKQLNELGLKGWELVAVSKNGVCYFKRELTLLQKLQDNKEK